MKRLKAQPENWKLETALNKTLARGKIAAPGALDASGRENPVTSGFADRRRAFPPAAWREINFSGFLPARPPFGL
jgi:hypothetical protein